jgi:hypothetical protein
MVDSIHCPEGLCSLDVAKGHFEVAYDLPITRAKNERNSGSADGLQDPIAHRTLVNAIHFPRW